METQLPEDFCCPISHEIMSDPVILCSGYTFDRSSIQRWLDTGHRTCPITQTPLPPRPSLIPNYALRSLISHFAQAHHISLSPTLPATAAATSATTAAGAHKSYPSSQRQKVKQLVSTLASPESTISSKLDALSLLRRPSKYDVNFRQILTESGGSSAILLCASDLQLQDAALSVLFNLSLDDDNKVGLVAEGALGPVVAALSSGSPVARALSATIITSLAIVEVNKGTIGRYPGAVESLVELLRDGNLKGKREAATALSTLCSFPDNKRRAVDAGAVPILLALAAAEESMERPVEVLSLLSRCSEGREAIRNCRGGVQVLARILKDGRPQSRREHALAALSSLCSHSESFTAAAKRQGVYESCLEFIGDENGKVKRNASVLIQALERCKDGS
ncbi:unnamed protein product [Victoria cruziana]